MTPPAAGRMVPFDVAEIAVEQQRLAGHHELLAQQLNQAIGTLTGAVQAMQSDVRNLADTGAAQTSMMERLQEKSTGLERLAAAIEKGDTRHASSAAELVKIQLQVSHWRGMILGVVFCGSLTITSAVAYIVYRFDQIESQVKNVQLLEQSIRPGTIP